MKSARERPQKTELVGWQGERERKREGREGAGEGKGCPATEAVVHQRSRSV